MGTILNSKEAVTGIAMLITNSWTVRQQVLCHCIEENFETFPGSNKLSNDETRIFSNSQHKRNAV